MPANTTPHRTEFARRYGPWAVVTGASDGIGRACAGELARRGLSLILVARRAPELQALADELQRLHGTACVVLAVDLGHTHGVEAVVDAAFDHDVGLLVAAAGFGTAGAFVNADLADESGMAAVNCGAVLSLCWYFARRLAARGRGGLVLMSSVVAFQGTAHAAHYAATKAYVQTLAEGLHAELAPLGVDVVASAPGPVHSGFAARAGMHMGVALQPPVVARVTLDALGRRCTVRPGWLSRLLGASLATLPRWGRIRVMSLVMKGMAVPAPAASAAARRASN